jgi:hypothetical protein
MRSLLIAILISASACVVKTAPGATTTTAPPPAREGAPQPAGAVLTGQLTDAKTHQPVKGAVDVVNNATHEKFTVETGPDGRYTTQRVPAGDFAVRARAGGYESLNQAVNVGNTEARLDFNLVPNR